MTLEDVDFRTQALVRGLLAQRAMRTVEIAEVLSLLELREEDLGIIDHDAVRHPVTSKDWQSERETLPEVRARSAREGGDIIEDRGLMPQSIEHGLRGTGHPPADASIRGLRRLRND